MGSASLHKKRMKKRIKTSGSDPELVDEGDDAVASGQYNSEKDITSSHSGDAETGKTKKSGMKKRKHTATVQIELPEQEREVKAKQSGKKKKKHVAAAELVELPEKGNEDEPKNTSKTKKSGKQKKKIHVAADGNIELPKKRRADEPNSNNQASPENGSSLATENKQNRSRKVGRRKDNRAVEEQNKPIPGKEIETDEVYEISSEDEDDSSGMRKWIRQYHDNRPGLKVLQERIDDFVTEYWEQEEQARKDREAKAAEDGWTVVVHKKGGKKTADPESGVAVGSVNQAAVLEKMSNKKSKEVALDFYRFQRREAQRNEVMKLQSKFEEDKKRIQQMRASRKFRPY